MKVGLLYFVYKPDWVNRQFRDVYAETLEHMQAMEEMGFASINMTEFHFGTSNNGTPSPLVWNAAAAVRTKRALIGQGVAIAPYIHPVKMAEDMATIDILSNGRFWFGAGEANRSADFAAFGIERKQRGTMTAESMEIIRKCWTEEEFSYQGRHYKLSNVRMVPKPLQRPHPPMFLSAMVPGLRPMERTVEMGFHAMTGHGLDNLGEAMWEQWWAGWEETVRRHGKDPSQFQTCAMTYLFVTPDPERLWSRFKDNPQQPRNEADGTYGRPSSALPPQDRRAAFKTPDEAVSFLRNRYGKHPPTHLLLHPDYPGMTKAESYDCLSLFMSKVMPKLRDLTAQP